MGIAYHVRDFSGIHPFPYDALWALLVRFLAIVAGAYMLLGRNWARWLALAWIAFHVVLSAFHSLPEFAMHILLLAVIAYVLLRPSASRHFTRSPAA